MIKRRMLSLLTAFVTLFSLLPVNALAATDHEQIGDTLYIYANCNPGTFTDVTFSEIKTVRIGPNAVNLSYANLIPFESYVNLESFVVDGGNQIYVSYDGVLFIKSNSELSLLCYPRQKTDGFVAPAGMTAFAQNAFFGVSSANIYIHASTLATVKDNVNAFANQESETFAAQAAQITFVENEVDATGVALSQKNGDVLTPLASPASLAVDVGGALSLSADVSLSDTPTASDIRAALTAVTWSSSDETVATVDSDGTVTGVACGRGSATITATSRAAQGISASCTVSVRPLPTELALSAVDGEGVSSPVTEALSLRPGEKLSLRASVSPEEANQAVLWTSSDETVATVDSDGTVAAVAHGSVTITAAAASGSAVEARCTVNVEQPAEGVALNKTELMLEPEDTFQLTATPEPENTTDAVTWSSSNEAVATVSNGLVTAVAVGSATVTATINGHAARCGVTVTKYVTGVSVDPREAFLKVAETKLLKEILEPEDAESKSIEWESGGTGVATVDGDTGLVTAVAPGDETITVRAVSKNDNVKTGSATVKVRGITLTESVRMKPGDDPLALRVTTEPAGLAVTWESSDETVAKVDDDGKVTAVAVGSATVTATMTESGFSAECAVTVDPIPATGIALPEEVKLPLYESSDSDADSAVFKSIELNAAVLPDSTTYPELRWEYLNSASDFVSIESQGDTGVKITAKALGDASLLATVVNTPAVKKQITVRVVPVAVEGISIAGDPVSLEKGDSRTLIPVFTPANAADRSVTWESSDRSVATVDAHGVVTAVAPGDAVITATAGDGGYSSTRAVKVHSTAVTSIELDKNELSLDWNGGKNEDGSKTGSLTAAIEPLNASNLGVDWTSEDPSIATVSETSAAGNASTAVVTAVGAGTVKIWAKASGDSTKAASCTVTIPYPVTGVSVEPASVELTVGETLTLAKELAGWNGHAPDAGRAGVTWSSDRPDVVSVNSETGEIKALALTGSGDATVTVTTADGGYTASCAVSVITAVTEMKAAEGGEDEILDVKIDASPAEDAEAQSLSVWINPDATHNTVTWTSSDTSIAELRAPSGANVTGAAGANSVRARLLYADASAGVTVAADAGGKASVVIIPRGTGDVTVTAEAGGKKKEFTLHVTNWVKGVSLEMGEDDEPILHKGETFDLTAFLKITPANADGATVSWSSSDETVATVADGTVKALASGSATVTAKVTDPAGKEYSATCGVTVAVPVESLAVEHDGKAVENGATLEFVKGPYQNLTATVTPANATLGNVTWESSAPAIVDISAPTASDGVSAVRLIPVAYGTATVTVKADDKTVSFTVRVYNPATDVTISSSEDLPLTLASGTLSATTTLSAVVAPADTAYQGVRWKIESSTFADGDNPSVSIDENGVFTIVGALTGDAAAVVSATSEFTPEKSAAYTVTVKPVQVTDVALSKTSATLNRGATLVLTADVAPANAANREVEWSLQTGSEAYVSLGEPFEQDDMPAIKVSADEFTTEGAVVLVTTKNGGKTASCIIYVQSTAVNGIELYHGDEPVSSESSAVTLDYHNNKTTSFTATVDPAGASVNGVNWSVSSPGVIRIIRTETGGSYGASSTVTIEAVGAGDVTLTATAQGDSGIYKSCAVTVPNCVTGVDITPESGAIDIGGTLALPFTLTELGTGALADSHLTWSSSDTSVATVSENGTVSGEKAGVAIITATADDGGASDTCVITVRPNPESVALKLGGEELSNGDVRYPDVGDTLILTASTVPAGANQEILWDVEVNLIVISEEEENDCVKFKTDGGTIELDILSACDLTVTASSASRDSISASAAFKARTLTLDNTTLHLQMGDTDELKATVAPADDSMRVRWRSSAPDIVEVNEDGELTALAYGRGDAIITAELLDGDGNTIQTATCRVIVDQIKATGLTLMLNGEAWEEESAEFIVGSFATLTAVVTPAFTTDAIVWSSSDTTVATVGAPVVVRDDGTNTVTSTVDLNLRRDGTAKISVAAGDYELVLTAKVYANATGITVTPADDTIVLQLDKVQLDEGNPPSVTLSAEISPANANPGVKWSVSPDEDEVVSLSYDEGAQIVVYGMDFGTAIVTAKSKINDLVVATRTIEVIHVQATGVTLSESSHTVVIGDHFELTATVSPDNAANREVVWESSDSLIATVSDGVVNAVGVGQATISAKTGNGHSASCVVTVTEKKVTDIELNAAFLTLDLNSSEGKSATLTATLTPADATNQELIWLSGNTGAVTVEDASGLSNRVTAVGPGTATITAISKSDQSKRATCEVTVPTPATGISLTADDGAEEIVLDPGDSVRLTASVLPDGAANREINFSFEKKDLLNYIRYESGESGAAYYLQLTLPESYSSDAFSTKITATAMDGGYSRNIQVTLRPGVSSVTLSASSMEMKWGETAKLTAAVAPESANPALTWSSSDESVATVDQSGNVTTLAAGSAVITAKAKNGKTADCTITVGKKDISLMRGEEALGDSAIVLMPANDTASVRFSPYESEMRFTMTPDGDASSVSYLNAGDTIAFTSLKNGAYRLRIQRAEDDRYKAFDQTVTVRSICVPVHRVSVNTAAAAGLAANGINLTASLDTAARVISVAGYAPSGRDASSVDLTGKLDFDLEEPSSDVTYNGDTVTVSYGGKSVLYTINRSITSLPSSLSDGNVIVDTTPSASESSPASITVQKSTESSVKAAAVPAILSALSTLNVAPETITGLSLKVTIDDVQNIQTASDEEHSNKILSFDIQPSFTATAGEETFTYSLNSLPAPITFTVRVNFMPRQIRHTHTENGVTSVQYPAFSCVSDGADWLVTWQQSTFSKVEILEVSRSGFIAFDYANGSSAMVPFDETDIGRPLPTAERDGYAFNGWEIDGVSGVVTTLTEAVLNAIDGFTVAAPVAARANYTQNARNTDGHSYSDSSGGAASAGPEASKPAETPVAEAKTFSDVAANHWAAEAIDYVVSRGIFNGVGNDAFAPELAMSRAMIAQMLCNFDGGEPAASASPFSDTAGKWYDRAANWAAALGVAVGSYGRFDGDDAVTREQLAVMLYRYARAKDWELSADASALAGFGDADAVSDWAEEAMRWAIDRGLIGGTDRGLEPAAPSTRAQVATIMMRFCETVVK